MKNVLKDQKALGLIASILLALGTVLSIVMTVLSYTSSTYLTLQGLTRAWWAYLVLALLGGALACLCHMSGFEKERNLAIASALSIVIYLVLIALCFIMQGIIGFGEALS